MIYPLSSKQKRRDGSTMVLFLMHPAEAKGTVSPDTMSSMKMAPPVAT